MRATLAPAATLLLAAALILPAAACFKNPTPDCAFECVGNGACPDGYTCRPDGLCKRVGVADDFACPDVDLVDAPAVDAPLVDAPAVDAPLVDAPAVDAPLVDAPAIDAPAIDAPPVDAPPVDAPIDAPTDATVASLIIETNSPLDFGNQTTSTTTMQTIMVVNTGMSPSSAITLDLTGNTPQFALVAGGTDTCSGNPIAGGNGCSFEVSFTPDQVQSYTATVTVMATTGGSPMITVNGSGI